MGANMKFFILLSLVFLTACTNTIKDVSVSAQGQGSNSQHLTIRQTDNFKLHKEILELKLDTKKLHGANRVVYDYAIGYFQVLVENTLYYYKAHKHIRVYDVVFINNNLCKPPIFHELQHSCLNYYKHMHEIVRTMSKDEQKLIIKHTDKIGAKND